MLPVQLQAYRAVQDLNTDDELADLLTKAIAREDEKFKRFRNALMNIE